jgi:hypothetical protein
LAPDTTYHYRVDATNGFGATHGADVTFTTLPPAPGVGSATATGIAATSATLNGTIDPNGGWTSYHFEYGPDAAYGSQVPAVDDTLAPSTSTQTVGVGVTGLQAGTTYHYRLVASNAGGVNYSDDGTFTTKAAVPTLALSGTGVVKHGTIALEVACRGAAGATCTGQLVLSAREQTRAIKDGHQTVTTKTVVIARTRYKIAVGSKIVVLTLTRAGTRWSGQAAAKLSVIATLTQGGRHTRKAITLDRPR